MSGNLVRLNTNGHHAMHKHPQVVEDLKEFCQERGIEICGIIKYPDTSTGYFISEDLTYLEACGLAAVLSDYTSAFYRERV